MRSSARCVEAPFDPQFDGTVPCQAEGAPIGAHGSGQRSAALRVLAGLSGVALGFAGAALLALGTCHDSGGFCAESFGVTHVLLYALGVVMLSSAAGVLAAAVTSRRDIARGIASTAALLLLVVIVVVEATG